MPHVVVDNYNGSLMAMQHLLGKKYRRIAFVTIQLDQVQMHQRRQAYEDTLREAGLPVEEEPDPSIILSSAAPRSPYK